MYAYSSATDQLMTIPQPDGQFNEVTVYVIIATIGSSKTEYIQTIKTVGKVNANDGVRTLKFRFVNPAVDVEQ